MLNKKCIGISHGFPTLLNGKVQPLSLFDATNLFGIFFIIDMDIMMMVIICVYAKSPIRHSMSVTWLQPARNIPLEYAVIELKLNRMEISVEFSCVLWIWWYLKRTETSGSVVCPRWQWRHHCFLCHRNGATVNVNIQIDSAFHSLCQSTSNGLYSHNFDFRLNNINWRIDRMERRSICARAKIGRARVCALLTWTKTKKLISNFTTSCTNCSSNAIDVPNYLGPRQPKTQFCYS